MTKNYNLIFYCMSIVIILFVAINFYAISPFLLIGILIAIITILYFLKEILIVLKEILEKLKS